MKRVLIPFCVLLLFMIACSLRAEAPKPVQAGSCGDGVCEGPENKSNCPADCDRDVCDLPNPRRAVVSSDLLEFRSIFDDSGFEEGQAEVITLPHSNPALELGNVERIPEAAHNGDWVYQIEAGPGEGATFAAQGYVEKGEELHFSAWVRAPQEKVSLTPQVFWVEHPDQFGPPVRGETIIVGADWTRIELTMATTIGARYALFAFEVGPESQLQIDDIAIEVPFWRMAEYAEGQGQTIGGVNVPATSAAPTHFNVIIHIEDPNLLQNSRAYFEEQSTIFTELARIIHEHGGFLTIQPEQDWPQAAEGGFHPGLLRELNQKYGVVYSNHTHGPICVDERGLPRSSADCRGHPDWNHSTSPDDIVAYAKLMRDFFSTASGTQVTDHNGNFDFTATSRLAEAGIETLSVFKDRTTQSSYDYLYNNPWRPGQGNALEDIQTFLTHDPNTEIVYIPGWGQALTRHPWRVNERIRPMLSQFIRYADPQRVNSFYVITHVGHFYSRTGDPNYLKFNEQTGEVDYSAEFREHLAHWDTMLTETIDPLVAAGYLQWTSLSEIGNLYREWASNCGEIMLH